MLVFPSEVDAHTSKETIIFVQIFFRKLVIETHCDEFEEKSQMRKFKKIYITLIVQIKQNTFLKNMATLCIYKKQKPLYTKVVPKIYIIYSVMQ